VIILTPRATIMRIAVLVAVFAVASLALAAPVPRETAAEKLRRLYGIPEDPDSVCTFRLHGERLHLTAAKGLRGLNPSRGLVNAPRTLKPVEGDFVVTTRLVRDAVAEGTERADDVYTPSGGGGLLVWVDSNTHLRLSRSQWIADGGNPPRSSYNLRGVANGNDLQPHQNDLAKPDTEPVSLRISRIGRLVTGGYSHDGKMWTEFPAVAIDLPPEVKVGVYAAHNFNQELELVFEPLLIEKPQRLAP
jgi:hypothetical protein